MAKLIKANGEVTTVTPKFGKQFTGWEIHELVGGYIEAIPVFSHHLMFLNEEGKLLNLPHNRKATDLYGHPTDWIAGDVVICDRNEVEDDRFLLPSAG